MEKNDWETVKVLILTSFYAADADKIVQDYLEQCFPSSQITFREKSAFIMGMFGVKILGPKPNNSDEGDETDYYALLLSVINQYVS